MFCVMAVDEYADCSYGDTVEFWSGYGLVEQ